MWKLLGAPVAMAVAGAALQVRVAQAQGAASAGGSGAPKQQSQRSHVSVNSPMPSSTASSAMQHSRDFDVVIIGAGIVGLATAREIINRYPDKTVCVLEKEAEVAAHQTGHNSGVIHAGMYYEPGSTMAKCCVRGLNLMYEYCDQKGLPYDRCGKLIVAATEEEHATVEALYERGTTNGVRDLEIVHADRMRELEPNVRGYSALYSPHTGVVDFAVVARSFAEDLLQSGRGSLRLRFEAKRFEETTDVSGGERIAVYGTEPGQRGPVVSVTGKHVITCAGLYSDRVARAAGGSRNPRVVPFRGTYYQLKEEYRNLCRMNIYPVPGNSGIPVGVHFTPTVNERRGHGTIIGPGACIAFHREGYTFTDLSLRDVFDALTQVGVMRFVLNNFSLAVTELYRDLNKRAFMKAAQKLVPSVTEDMTEMSFAGVMVQVMTSDGNAASDFIFERACMNGKALHVRSAPSPACTSSMAIAEWIVDVAQTDFKWVSGERQQQWQ
ncbi:L-2-hydroxyglutarate dehydrogenase [Salpingoeca rosetta]|uniref:L-2-hydroxyglutarate dehydrogenase, mitochondrial n=1 Tax=Salpingoeca rosetta (strain ATCC 50818 / BSB-021) TaxID=946362 RepID=F2TY28_SALR5|nr:L-2-hydroxyglutarate dehydrogenase [Salpingoeca rosetta]EGD76287.1 L-2-hydroxyglutarate dehydrogenase [Salpingoeca rosetta]|eukprot:XP_004998462.1 L-2-hydroxyglutarate dehydrogenase [Salpingoeca rosetta]